MTALPARPAGEARRITRPVPSIRTVSDAVDFTLALILSLYLNRELRLCWKREFRSVIPSRERLGLPAFGPPDSRSFHALRMWSHSYSCQLGFDGHVGMYLGDFVLDPGHRRRARTWDLRP